MAPSAGVARGGGAAAGGPVDGSGRGGGHGRGVPAAVRGRGGRDRRGPGGAGWTPPSRGGPGGDRPRPEAAAAAAGVLVAMKPATAGAADRGPLRSRWINRGAAAPQQTRQEQHGEHDTDPRGNVAVYVTLRDGTAQAGAAREDGEAEGGASGRARGRAGGRGPRGPGAGAADPGMAAAVQGVLRDRLVACGLAEPLEAAATRDAGRAVRRRGWRRRPRRRPRTPCGGSGSRGATSWSTSGPTATRTP